MILRIVDIFNKLIYLIIGEYDDVECPLSRFEKCDSDLPPVTSYGKEII